jgi:non-specific serine/threonine protein kinase
VRSLSVEKIAERLTDRFRLLTQGHRTDLPRQQTLRALIDWSFDLLGEKERTLFCRLSVFAGGWALNAAEAVCAGGDIAERDVLHLLADLVDKSLVTTTAESGRYGLLETIRQYAGECLTQSNDGDATRSRHVDFYLAFVEQVAPDLFGKKQATTLQQLDFERENILSAHGWCLRNKGFAERDYGFVHAIKHYWFMRGLLNLGYRITTEAVLNPDGPTTGIARCRALFVAGQICSFMGRYAEAQAFLEESLSMARKLEDSRLVAVALTTLGLALFGQGDRAAARLCSGEALEIAEQSGNKRQIASACNGLAQLLRWEGDIERAEALYLRVVTLARELGDRELTAVGLLNLAMVAVARKSAERASESLREVVAIVAETASRSAAQSALDVSVGLACLQGEWIRAARYWGAAQTLIHTIGVQRDPADEAFVAPMVAEARRELGTSHFDAEEAYGRGLPLEAAVADAQTWLSRM